jgi:hypothetical protein
MEQGSTLSYNLRSHPEKTRERACEQSSGWEPKQAVTINRVKMIEKDDISVAVEVGHHS